jgi:iron complex transport system permease protein
MEKMNANNFRQGFKKNLKLYGTLIPVLLISIVFSIGIGAVKIPPLEVISHFLDLVGLPPLVEINEQHKAVMMAIRLPRVVLALLVGAGLAVSGATMQGLFRNPLADPGLLGVSSGASFAVACSVVMGFSKFGVYTLPIAAFIGSIAAIALIYSLAQQDKKTNIATMLLAGIAINALCGSGTGLFTYLSTDEELRTITFWQLGSLGGATWTSIKTAGPLIVACVLGMPLLASSLNAFLLGESNAKNLGIPVEMMKWIIVVMIALGVGAGVAVAGMIGFVGLVVPHLIRLWLGPNHRILLPGSALLGAIMLILADLLSRTIVAPAELPIGIITAITGSPFFLYLLLKNRRLGKL